MFKLLFFQNFEFNLIYLKLNKLYIYIIIKKMNFDEELTRRISNYPYE